MNKLILIVLFLSCSDRVFAKDTLEEYHSLKIKVLRTAREIKSLEFQTMILERFIEIRSLCLDQLQDKEFPHSCYELIRLKASLKLNKMNKRDKERILDRKCENFQFKINQISELKDLIQNQNISSKCRHNLEKKYQVIQYQSESEQPELVF